MSGQRRDMHPLAAPAAGPFRPHMPLHPYLRGFVVITLADLFPDALHTPAHAFVLTVLGLIRHVVHDILARQMRGDDLAAPAVSLACVCGNLSGAGLMCGVGRLDGGQHLGFVEQHFLLGAHLRAAFLRGAAEELLLEPAYLFLQQQHSFTQVLVLRL
jgi:hypothetical protein